MDPEEIEHDDFPKDIEEIDYSGEITSRRSEYPISSLKEKEPEFTEAADNGRCESKTTIIDELASEIEKRGLNNYKFVKEIIEHTDSGEGID